MDPIPTCLLRDVLPVLSPIITEIVNTAVSRGTFPSDLKSAIAKPLQKKFGPDKEVLKNFRPVSNLPFPSKVIDKVMTSRLLDHYEYILMDPMQSA